MNHLKHSSTWRFFRYALSCFMAIVLFFTAIYAFVIYKHENSHLNEGLQNIDSTLVPELVAALWVTDHAAVQRIMEAMTRFRYVDRVEVRDDEGTVFVAGKTARFSLDLVARDLTYGHKDESLPIGSLSLFIDRQQMVVGLIRSALLSLALQVCLSLFLAGVMAVAFHLAFGRYLQRFARFIESDDPTRFHTDFALGRKTPPADELQLLVAHFNGLRIKINSYFKKMETANAELSAINAQLQESERRLRVSQARFAGAFEYASIGMALVAPDGRWLQVNPAGCAMLGYSSDELLTMRFQDLTHPQDLEADLAQMRRVLAGEMDTYRMEKRYLHKSGRPVWALLNAALVRDHKGRPLHFISQFVDITGRKEAEAKMLHLQKAESLGRMAGAVAHHYNNLLTAVSGNLELALASAPRGTGPPEELLDALDAARRASRLGAMMLTYLGQTVTRRDRQDLSAICRRVLEEFRGEAPGHVTLKTDLSPAGPTVKIDREQIHQVVTNLLTNALEALGDRPGSISLSLRTVSAAAIPSERRWPVDFQGAAAGYAGLEVSDTGGGVAPNDLEKLFDPFFSTKFTGRGLGLAVALGIVRAHDGCIAVQSTAAAGSVFAVFLPLEVEEAMSAS